MSLTNKRAITTKVNGDKAVTNKKDKDIEVVLTRYGRNFDGCIENGYSNVAFEGDKMTDIALETDTLDEGKDLISLYENIINRNPINRDVIHFRILRNVIKQLIFRFKARIRFLHIEYHNQRKQRQSSQQME